MKPDWKTCFRICVSVFLLYICMFYWEGLAKLLVSIVSAATPLLLGFVIAYVLNILMSFYEKHYFPKLQKPWVFKSRKGVCLLAAFVTLAGIVTLVIGLVVPELVSCVKLLLESIEPAVEALLDSKWIGQVLPAELLNQLDTVNWQEYLNKGIQILISGIGGAAGAIYSTVSSLLSTLVTAFISLIFAIYLLLSRERLKSQCGRALHCYLPGRWQNRVFHWLDVFNDCFHRYIVGQCLEAVILGILCIFGMTIFRFPYAMMIGTLIGFTALIPIAGAYIGAGVGAVMILTESPLKALLFLLFIVVLQQLEGNLIYPKVVGSSIGLPALWVLAAVTVGGSLMGVLGMLLGVPIAAALYRLLKEDVLRREKLQK